MALTSGLDATEGVWSRAAASILGHSVCSWHCCSSWASSESTFFQAAGLPLPDSVNPYHMTMALRVEHEIALIVNMAHVTNGIVTVTVSFSSVLGRTERSHWPVVDTDSSE